MLSDEHEHLNALNHYERVFIDTNNNIHSIYNSTSLFKIILFPPLPDPSLNQPPSTSMKTAARWRL